LGDLHENGEDEVADDENVDDDDDDVVVVDVDASPRELDVKDAKEDSLVDSEEDSILPPSTDHIDTDRKR
jgi:hypothetical protein